MTRLANGLADPVQDLQARAGEVDGPNEATRDGAMENYASAVSSGFYQRHPGGLWGKHDNVRRYWEDQITRYALSRFLEPLHAEWRRSLTRLRVLDLGAGAGEGYELLTSLSKVRTSLTSAEVDVLPSETLGYYKGVDLSPEMVEQGRLTYAGIPKVEFDVLDLTDGLGAEKEAPPYHIYFSSYGSLSHLDDDDLRRLIEEIYEHQGQRAVFVADLLGRYSYEWQCYWGDSGTDATNMRQYSMSDLYPPDVLEQMDVEVFPIRYWAADEFDDFVEQTVSARGGRVTRRLLMDRSVLVGRHMNTAEFNPYARPIRAAVNSLHEFNVRTDLEALIFDFMPQPGFDELNGFFDRFQMVWNAVVYGAIEALEHADDGEWLRQPPSTEYPPFVQEAISTIRDVVRNVHWFRMGDPMANIVEPQLGFVLRDMEIAQQQSVGAGHGLLALYEFEKSA